MRLLIASWWEQRHSRSRGACCVVGVARVFPFLVLATEQCCAGQYSACCSASLSLHLPMVSFSSVPSHRSSLTTSPVPSAASFYIPSIPHIHQNVDIPLQLYGGHLSADPNASRASPTDVTSHLYFFMVKNRRTTDKQRLIFWFNVRPSHVFSRFCAYLGVGWSRVLVIRRLNDGSRSLAVERVDFT
jgi:hypothetical protein